MKRRKSENVITSNFNNAGLHHRSSSIIPTLRMSGCLFFICIAFLVIQSSEAMPEARCPRIDLRNNPMQNWKPEYANCTVIEGHLIIVFMNENTTSDSYPVFRQLREVTGHILVFSADKLVSLGNMLPELRVIGGATQIQHYSLIVYQNEHIRELNLQNLRVFRNGGVRIQDNEKLCYAKSIDWKHMQFGNMNDIVIDDADGTRENPCFPYCFKGHSQEECPKTGNSDVAACWGKHSCQKRCPHDRHPLDHTVIGPGCVDNTTIACHNECIAGCRKQNDPFECYACRTINYLGECRAACPENMFSYRDRRCLTEFECLKTEPYGPPGDQVFYKALNGKCSYICPEGHEDDPNNPKRCRPCEGECFKKCVGNQTITSIHQAELLTRCTVIDGYLEIDMRVGLDLVPAADLSKAFKSIREINGYLSVRWSHAFMNLHMFENLELITGEILDKDKYALVIYENHNLQKLFQTKNKLRLAKGTAQINNNQMLCPAQVFELLNITDHLKELSAEEGSLITNSNGDKAVCTDSKFGLHVFNETDIKFAIAFPQYDTSIMDYRKFLGYEVFYKEVEKRENNITTDHDRSACSDSWNSIVIPVKMQVSGPEETVILKNTDKNGDFIDEGNQTTAVFTIQPNTLRPNTLYAVYVQATVVRHAGAIGYISSVAFAETKYGTPDPPKITRAESLSPYEIKIEWEPPHRPNGNITYYKISYYPQGYDVESLQSPAVCSGKAKTRTVDEKTTTVSPLSNPKFASIFLSTASPDTCAANGCCSCQANSRPAAGKMEKYEPPEQSDNFENELQNNVFVQNCNIHWDPVHCHHAMPENAEEKKARDIAEAAERRRRAIYDSAHVIRGSWLGRDRERNIVASEDVGQNKGRRRKRDVDPAEELLKDSERVKPVEEAETEQAEIDAAAEILTDRTEIREMLNDRVAESESENMDLLREGIPKKIELQTSERFITISELNPYTDYWIHVVACQDANRIDSSCSKVAAKAKRKERTKPIIGADTINASTINVEVRNETDVYITFEPPTSPNGPVLGYTARIQNIISNATPVDQCEHIGKLLDATKPDTEENRWKPDVHGIMIKGLSEGDYRVEVRTISLYTDSSEPAEMEGTFNIYIKGFWSWDRILIALAIFFVIAGILAFVGNHYFRKYYGQRVKEYATQLISANPEYLSQADVYKADEWELKREDIILEEEIGHGTFGKVYRGEGKNVVSIKGVQFGECAVKTVAESASCAERVHFLMEAGVMKQFDASHIVKLFGVVSDGQPVLVVMEMMSRGNLRDHLRSRRPDNFDIPEEDKMPVPNLEQYFEWAAQIADGMAYLESLRFCHRDLAARNCMVHADLTVKIGDFGMARDLYYHEYYKPTGKRLMPVRWMAPESLKDGKFDTKSDVWAYGIVLYEMITLGQQPYQGLANDEILNYIGQSRRHLDQPQGCPIFWYELMEECWKYSPRDRPNFYFIVKHLLTYTSEQFRQNSYVVKNPYDDEEEGSPRSNDDIEQMEIAEDENEYVMKSANRAGLDEPGWGEGDSLAGQRIPNGHVGV